MAEALCPLNQSCFATHEYTCGLKTFKKFGGCAKNILQLKLPTTPEVSPQNLGRPAFALALASARLTDLDTGLGDLL